MCPIIALEALEPVMSHLMLQAALCSPYPTVRDKSYDWHFPLEFERITPTQFHLLYKAPREIIFPHLYKSLSSQEIHNSQTFKASQISKVSKSFSLKNSNF